MESVPFAHQQDLTLQACKEFYFNVVNIAHFNEVDYIFGVVCTSVRPSFCLSIQCTTGNFCQWKGLTGTVLSILENLRVKSEGHQMTRYGQKCSFGAFTLS